MHAAGSTDGSWVAPADAECPALDGASGGRAPTCPARWLKSSHRVQAHALWQTDWYGTTLAYRCNNNWCTDSTDCTDWCHDGSTDWCTDCCTDWCADWPVAPTVALTDPPTDCTDCSTNWCTDDRTERLYNYAMQVQIVDAWAFLRLLLTLVHYFNHA